jgi:hypothetical protein
LLFQLGYLPMPLLLLNLGQGGKLIRYPLAQASNLLLEVSQPVKVAPLPRFHLVERLQLIIEAFALLMPKLLQNGQLPLQTLLLRSLQLDALR